MAEYIEREAAIRAVEQVYHKIIVADEDPRDAIGTVKYRENVVFVSDAEKALENLQAADVKPVVRGEWIHHKGGYSDHYECTVCKKAIVLTERWNFCPNCGADMREVYNV